jgi:hypothetical protein
VKLQLFSDLHLETESFEPAPLPGAEALVLAGDIDTTWAAYRRFAGWPTPVWVVMGNHEFDGREHGRALVDFRRLCRELGLTLLERESLVHRAADGTRWRVLGCTRWADLDLLGLAQRGRCARAAAYFARLSATRIGEHAFDPLAQRELALASRAWLEAELARPGGTERHPWDRTLVVTHFAPSLRSADPRYGPTPTTASFCNADDELIVRADAWLHGHLHCRHDYRVARAGRAAVRVVSQARGLVRKGEADGHDPTGRLDLAV